MADDTELMDEDNLELVDLDDEDEEPLYGEQGSVENPFKHTKWVADGLTDLRDVATQLRAQAAVIDDWADRGWVLTDEVDGGYIYMHWAGDGAPPESDRVRGMM